MILCLTEEAHAPEVLDATLGADLDLLHIALQLGVFGRLPRFLDRVEEVIGFRAGGDGIVDGVLDFLP